MAASDPILKEGDEKMKKSLTAAESALGGLRTGRASAGLVEHMRIDYYGQSMPLKQLAAISVPDAKTLEIRPWDKNAIQPIEKGIAMSDLKLAPQRQGDVIRLVIPPMTAERRQDMIKLAKKTAEEGRVSIRNVRQETNNKLKAAKLPQDEEKRAQAAVQKLTDQMIAKLDDLVAKKETEISTV